MVNSNKLYASHLEQLAAMPKSKAFLGREFLTWLWYFAESPHADLDVKEKHTERKWRFDCWIDDRLVLESSRGLSHEHLLKGGDPSHSQEAGIALASGKTVRELKLGIHIKGVGDFTAVFSDGELSPRSLKLPVPELEEGEPHPQQQNQSILDRLRQTELFLSAFDKLFMVFMQQRISDEWETRHLPAVRAWIKKRQDSIDSNRLH